MAITYKVLGQINPTANTATALYTVPSGVGALISTMLVCNQASTAATFTLSIQPGGAVVSSKNYLNYNTTIAANDTIPMTLGLTLATTDVLTATASTGNISFGAFGAETTVDASDVPVISAVTVTNSSYATLSAIQVSTLGGYIKLTGSGFSANSTVYVNSVAAISTTCINSTEIRAQVPGAAPGSQALTIFSASGKGYRYRPGLPYSSAPTWTTGVYTDTGSIGVTLNTQLLATAAAGTGPITYSLTAGSTLPAGAALSSAGLITGTRTAGTYTFTVTATNALTQVTNQAVTLAVNSAPAAIDLLIVAGGGGGGYSVTAAGAGGGGAGGYRSLSGIGVTAGLNYAISIGAGGSGGFSANVAPATNGFDSSAWTEIATGGGRGASTALDAGSGGSGGGAMGAGGSAVGAGNAPTKTPVQGFSGGAGGSAISGQQGAGGGGGAATVGFASTGSASGAGGSGVIWIDGFAYAGGGGGGASNLSSGVATGGTGGGGAGSASNSAVSAVSGAVNTGGGGGGAGYTAGATGLGAAGGSGVVVVRYADTFSAPTATTGNPNLLVFGGFRTYTFVSSGSITF